jgi:hypothetical protein
MMLATAVSSSALVQLRLTNNMIQKAGAKALIQAVLHQTSLTGTMCNITGIDAPTMKAARREVLDSFEKEKGKENEKSAAGAAAAAGDAGVDASIGLSDGGGDGVVQQLPQVVGAVASDPMLID